MITIEITDEEAFKNRPRLPVEDKQLWLDALKSEKYIKGKVFLNKDDKLCCLGVWCEIENLPKIIKKNEVNYGIESYCSLLPPDSKFYNILHSTGEFKGFLINNVSSLTGVNDNTNTFDEVIEVIEKYF